MNNGDVFSFLGMHEHSSGKGLIVRALLPGAGTVDVIAAKDNQKVATLERHQNHLQRHCYKIQT